MAMYSKLLLLVTVQSEFRASKFTKKVIIKAILLARVISFVLCTICTIYMYLHFTGMIEVLIFMALGHWPNGDQCYTYISFEFAYYILVF